MNIKNFPWEDRKENDTSPVWRYSKNPIIGRYPVKNIARIFNSAVLPYHDGFVGIFRAEQHDGVPFLHVGYSKDAIHWDFEESKIKVYDDNNQLVEYRYMYDPRLVEIEGTYYAIFCTDNHGATLGLVSTKDFKTFKKIPDPFLPFNRNGVLFPRKINGKYIMMSRPSDSGHTPFGDIFLSESKDLMYWGNHRWLMGKNHLWWQNIKIGGGSIPIETKEGWLIFYHGVTGTANGFVYSMGAAILDLEDPSIVKYRCNNYLLTPSEPYEEMGFVPNVIFPCSALFDEKTGRIAIYYGAADSYIGLAFTKLDIVTDYIKTHAEK
ncbi:glycoside hydrolase family 130 protein [Acholeplasma hippikon]|nr:glycoside hydrolase family 130 protein [Acholeplasma hippikon]